jgi:hypothetical protein
MVGIAKKRKTKKRVQTHPPTPKFKFKKIKSHIPPRSYFRDFVIRPKEKRRKNLGKEKKKKKKEFRLGYVVCSYGRRQPTYEPTCLWL